MRSPNLPSLSIHFRGHRCHQNWVSQASLTPYLGIQCSSFLRSFNTYCFLHLACSHCPWTKRSNRRFKYVLGDDAKTKPQYTRKGLVLRSEIYTTKTIHMKLLTSVSLTSMNELSEAMAFTTSKGDKYPGKVSIVTIEARSSDFQSNHSVHATRIGD